MPEIGRTVQLAKIESTNPTRLDVATSTRDMTRDWLISEPLRRAARQGGVERKDRDGERRSAGEASICPRAAWRLTPSPQGCYLADAEGSRAVAGVRIPLYFGEDADQKLWPPLPGLHARRGGDDHEET